MSVQDHLNALADELAHESWRTKRKSEWTPEERAAYERWNRAEIARMKDLGSEIQIVLSTGDEGDDAPPHLPSFTIGFDRLQRTDDR